MKLNIIIFISFFTFLTSCNGQSNIRTANSKKQNEHIVTGDTVKELSNNIMVVYQDTKNNYWFGSWQDGLYKYDGKSIINYTSEHGLPHNKIDEIKEDNSGNLYFSSCSPVSSVTKFDGKKFTPLIATKTNDWKLQPGDLWFKHSYQNEKVYRFDGITLHELSLSKPPKLSNSFEIYSIYQDRKGSVWFGTNPSGVCRYNGKSFDWISESDVTEIHDGPANGVRSIAEDKNGDFWFNTEYRYNVYNKNSSTQSDTESPTFYNRIKSIGCLDGKKDGDLNEYLSIIKDNRNNLWIATYLHGVWKYDGEKISHYSVQVNSINITVFCLYKDNNGNIWLGTEKNGAFKFNGKTFEQFKL